MTKSYRGRVMTSIQETAESLHAAGVMDNRMLPEFDELCLTPVRPLRPKEIRALVCRRAPARRFLPAYLNVTKTSLMSPFSAIA